jgi:hypothetical protein
MLLDLIEDYEIVFFHQLVEQQIASGRLHPTEEIACKPCIGANLYLISYNSSTL